MEPFKNVFSPALVHCIADHLERQGVVFDRDGFESAIRSELGGLEFKQRAQLIADQIHLALPTDPADRARILLGMLHPDELGSITADSDDQGITGWGVQPLTMLVGQHGVADFDRSMDLLKAMTKRSSSEFGIRYFLLADQGRALDIMRAWIDDPNVHVRRLVSEGTRPRLPWAMRLPKLIADPSPMLPILTALRDDPVEYVRRSVANHLNDIAKDHPDLVADIATNWIRGADRNRERLVRHACRSLIKAGHPGALAAFGLEAPRIGLDRLDIVTPAVRYGDRVKFRTCLRSISDGPQTLVIDYLVHFLKANGTQAPKVFKWTTLTLAPGETRTLDRAHPIRPITTRRYYAGEQRLSLRINGRDFGDASFELSMGP